MKFSHAELNNIFYIYGCLFHARADQIVYHTLYCALSVFDVQLMKCWIIAIIWS